MAREVNTVHLLRVVFRRLGRFAIWLHLIALLLVCLHYSSFPVGLPWNAVSLIVGTRQFDYVAWELDAIRLKIDQTLYGLHPFMDEAARSSAVRVYMDDLRRAQELDGQITFIYSDTHITDREAASAEFRAERDALRASLRERQPLIEAILEGQVAAVLVDEGFGFFGQILPPVSAHFTRVPNLLVVSPRDRIWFDISLNLTPMSADEIDTLEQQIDVERDVSSLVVPLGGIALYPAMVLETASIPAALDTIAHEWLHHYLFAFPLGLTYFNGEGFAGETRIINETTASRFGQEISRLALARYYPDLLPPPPRPPSDSPLPPSLPTERPAFDFAREMDITRRRVDELLAEGKIDEAEAYMEERRALFIENRYVIRKLNQAFFAFYGGYQAGTTPGVGGADPIGPAVEIIYRASPSLYEWIAIMRNITSRDDLLAARTAALRD